jgi:hypothetical protein
MDQCSSPPAPVVSVPRPFASGWVAVPRRDSPHRLFDEACPVVTWRPAPGRRALDDRGRSPTAGCGNGLGAFVELNGNGRCTAVMAPGRSPAGSHGGCPEAVRRPGIHGWLASGARSPCGKRTGRHDGDAADTSRGRPALAPRSSGGGCRVHSRRPAVCRRRCGGAGRLRGHDDGRARSISPGDCSSQDWRLRVVTRSE